MRFIGALALLLTYNFDSACDPQEAACSVMQRISLHFLNEGMALQETFEELHFLLFAVSVVYICVVLMLLKVTQNTHLDTHSIHTCTGHTCVHY